MSPTHPIEFTAFDTVEMAEASGQVVVFVTPEGTMDQAARRANRLTRGAVARFSESESFRDAGTGQVFTLNWPVGFKAEALHIVVLPRRLSPIDARKAGVSIARAAKDAPMLIMAAAHTRTPEIAQGVALARYDFDVHKTSSKPDQSSPIRISHKSPENMAERAAPLLATATGVHTTRDLTNEPANILTTDEFVARIEAYRELGLEVEILDQKQLEKLGMRTLLSVGQASDMPSYVAVMQWNGGTPGDAPLALIGKGVVFDTGGVSMKPAAGMEAMTMDMGGAGVVTGVMQALALRKAKANVVGLVGLVENSVAGNATRPGDVIKTMKGDTVEIINTDAEGRLVLCDVMWFAQDRFKPAAMIDLATLTGAMIIALGHEKAGVFGNDDAFCNAFLKAAQAEDEGAWRMPLDKPYDELLKSRIADMKNIGGRAAGSITAAQFLQRFVQDGVPWIHLDIAGVASTAGATRYAPKGATGWGVRALDRLVRDTYEAE
ncbi:MAG: leucyl aminopeptidase [Paracoccaceae bacterium]|jgi:leucyl aminopeptidase